MKPQISSELESNTIAISNHPQLQDALCKAITTYISSRAALPSREGLIWVPGYDLLQAKKIVSHAANIRAVTETESKHLANESDQYAFQPLRGVRILVSVFDGSPYRRHVEIRGTVDVEFTTIGRDAYITVVDSGDPLEVTYYPRTALLRDRAFFFRAQYRTWDESFECFSFNNDQYVRTHTWAAEEAEQLINVLYPWRPEDACKQDVAVA